MPDTALPQAAIWLVTRQVIPVPCLAPRELVMANLLQEMARGLLLEALVRLLDLAMANLLRQHPVENLEPERLEKGLLGRAMVHLRVEKVLPALEQFRVEKVLPALEQFRVVKVLPALEQFRVEKVLPALEQFRVVKDFLAALASPVAKDLPAGAAVDSNQRLQRLGLRNILRSTWSWD
jgi:hypothetical protein